MRRTFGIGLAVAALALAVGCGKKPGTAPEPPPGPPSLAGGWTLIGVEAAGQKETDFSKQPAEQRKIRATADKLIATKDGKEEASTYKLDATKTPHEIDMTEPRNGKTETLYGIYKLEGDTLTICLVPSSNPADRPKEFKSEPGSKALILTLKKD